MPMAPQRVDNLSSNRLQAASASLAKPVAKVVFTIRHSVLHHVQVASQANLADSAGKAINMETLIVRQGEVARDWKTTFAADAIRRSRRRCNSRLGCCERSG